MTIPKKISTDSTTLTILALLANAKNGELKRQQIYSSCAVHYSNVRQILRSLDRRGYIEEPVRSTITITIKGVDLWSKYCHLSSIIFD